MIKNPRTCHNDLNTTSNHEGTNGKCLVIVLVQLNSPLRSRLYLNVQIPGLELQLLYIGHHAGLVTAVRSRTLYKLVTWEEILRKAAILTLKLFLRTSIELTAV